MRRLILLAGLAVLAAPAATAQNVVTPINCATNSTAQPAGPNGTIAWPAVDPIWEMDVYRPANRTTSQGTGIELRNVRYQGRKVFERAHAPILNVEYDAGAGCGCFRDWQYNEARFQADNPLAGASCFAESTPGFVETNCTADGAAGPVPDAGTFRGVSVEDYGDELVLTSNMSAGWYRYQMRWHFYRDGRIWPEYSFAAASNACTAAARRHHVYWRFDFDLDGNPTTDVVTETGVGRTPVVFTNEVSRTWGDPADKIEWTISDSEANVGWRLTPSAADLETPIDPFSKTDALVLRYRASEIQDASGSGCAFAYEPWLNNESLAGQDIVFWFRSSTTRPAGESLCEIAGPTLTPFGYTTVQSEAPPVAGAVEIQAAMPNPFTPQTSIRFRTAEAESGVRVVLYDLRGRAVRTLFEGATRAGLYETVEIQGGDLPAGQYVVRLEGASQAASTRVTLVR